MDDSINTNYKYLGYAKIFLLVPTLLLLAIGVFMQYSCDYRNEVFFDLSSIKAFLAPRPIRQILWIIIGGICAYLTTKIKYKTIIETWTPLVLYGSCILLAYLAFGSLINKEFPFFGSTKGGYRWLQGPGFLEFIKIQPSEFAKLSMTIYICAYFAKYRFLLSPSKPFLFLRMCWAYLLHKIKPSSYDNQYEKEINQVYKEYYHGFIFPVLIMSGVSFLVLCGRSLSMTILFGVQCFMLALCSGFRWIILIFLFLGLSYGIWCGHNYGENASFQLYRQETLYQPVDNENRPLEISKYNILQYLPKSIAEERLDRLNSWKYPELLQITGGAQLWRSQLALGSGGLKGLGWGESRIKRDYLPEAHNDFIISICGEEFGFIGTFIIIILYVWLVLASYWIAWLAYPHYLYSLSAMGLGLTFGGHAFINIGVASGFLPTTGITAPFLSYGGSSMIVSLVTIGLLICIANDAYDKGYHLEQAHSK